MPAATVIQSLSDAIINAQFLAVRALTKLLETADDPRELRRIATALLKLKPAAPEPPPAPSANTEPLKHATPEPLLPTELADLHALFPDVRADHFTRSHSPAYWRGIIRRHAATPAAARPTSAAHVRDAYASP